MWPDGTVTISLDGRVLPAGRWSAGTIDLPPEAIPDAADRAQLQERLRVSASATGDFRLFHYRAVRGDRHGNPKLDESITIIREQAFHFSDPTTFTDTSDCRLDWDRNLSPEEEEAFYRAWLSPHFSGTALEIEVVFHLFQKTALLGNFERIYQPRIESGVALARILCLTTRGDNPKMWREYADDYTGVCFELSLPANDEGPLAAAQVTYAKSRRVKLSPNLLAMARGVYCTKSLEYQDEDEYRLIDLAKSDQPDNRLRVVDAVHGIIFGPRIDPAHRTTLLDAVRHFRPALTVRQAHLLGDGTISLELLDLS